MIQSKSVGCSRFWMSQVSTGRVAENLMVHLSQLKCRTMKLTNLFQSMSYVYHVFYHVHDRNVIQTSDIKYVYIA